MKVAVIGAGAYGSYTISAVQRKFPDAEITLFDVGNEQVKSESQIGYKSILYGDKYTGLENGRYFGFGGATSRWGGQLLMFSEKDFESPSRFLRDIVAVAQKHKAKVFDLFGIAPDFNEPSVDEKLFVKTGVWLGYFSRNLFKHFKVARRKNVKINTNARVVRVILSPNRTVNALEYLHEGVICQTTGFDYYFLTAGAFESVRILLSSDEFSNKKVPFSDHLSQKVFKIKGGTVIGGHDFVFRVKGTSLITKRMIGEIDGVSFFANPIYNSDFPFFQNLKAVLFKRDFSLNTIWKIIKDVPSCLVFTWSIFVLRKIYVYKNEWYLYIDIENPEADSSVSLSSDIDRYGIPALNVDFHIGAKATSVYCRAREQVRKFLKDNNVTFEECDEKIQVDKCEDTYHPYGMLCEFGSLKEYFSHFSNMLVVNTGVLPRAGGINSTAAMFPVIEEYVESVMK